MTAVSAKRPAPKVLSAHVPCPIPLTDIPNAALAAIAGPVLVIGGGADRIVPTRLARRLAARYRNGTYSEVPGSDHLVLHGNALSVAMGQIDDWIARNHVLATA
jgi:pimeloyl-ACP methyl ester carboxylesterase